MKYNVSEKGFSLVETLVAITILLLVIIGPMTISSRTAQSTSFSSEQVIAFFLAQEGAELAQKARDDLLLRQFLSSNDPLYLNNYWSIFSNQNGAYRECYEPAGCGLEITGNNSGSLITPLDCGTFDLCRLYLDESAGNIRSHYTHTSTAGDPTIFTRKIFFDWDGIDQVKVTSQVTWQSGVTADDQEVAVETYLFNIYEN